MEPPPPRPPRDASAFDAAQPPARGPFSPPCKRVASRAALAQWAASPAHADLLGFVRALADAVRGAPLSAPAASSPAVDAVVAVLATLEARLCTHRRCRARCCDAGRRAHAAPAQGWIAEIPPATQAMRYGNTAYRTWRVAAPAALHPRAACC